MISPCLCNLYLHRLDRQWTERGRGVLVRFADDLLVMCRTQAEADAALASLRQILAELGLQLKDAKTRIVHLKEGGEGLDFLGFHHRWVRAKGARHVQFLARWPSRRAMQRARERVREHTARERLLLPIEEVVLGLNKYLHGWAGYFRYGNSARHFNLIEHHAHDRLALFVAKRHQRARASTCGNGCRISIVHAEDTRQPCAADRVVGKKRVTSGKRAALWSRDDDTEHTAVGVGRALRLRDSRVGITPPRTELRQPPKPCFSSSEVQFLSTQQEPS